MKLVKENIEIIGALIEKYIVTERKSSIKSMLESPVGELFFMSPLTSVESFGFCHDGGLAAHSIEVFRNLKKLNDAFGANFSDESMLVCALFHYIGRCCDSSMKSPYYIGQKDDWKIEKGYLYDVSDEGVFMTRQLKSLFVLSNFGIQMSPEEFTAIYLCDGFHTYENKAFVYKEPRLALFLAIANRISLAEQAS